MGFSEAYSFTARWEGGLSDNPADRGGITSFGISLVFLRDFARRKPAALCSLGIGLPVTEGSIRRLGREQARAIMKNEFWDEPGLDRYPPRMALAMFDCGVNSGPGRAARCLQEALNSVCACGLAVDGVAGPRTRAAVAGAFARDLPVALEMVESRRRFLERLCKANPSQAVFRAGWLNRLNDLRGALLHV